MKTESNIGELVIKHRRPFVVFAHERGLISEHATRRAAEAEVRRDRKEFPGSDARPYQWTADGWTACTRSK